MAKWIVQYASMRLKLRWGRFRPQKKADSMQIVEQNGSNFSGGQRQRLAIARTIIKSASIYVLTDSIRP